MPNSFTPCAKDRANDKFSAIGLTNPIHVKNEKPLLPDLLGLRRVRDRKLCFVAMDLLEKAWG